MESWDGLRLGLLALGYRKITYLQLGCACGDFRSGVEQQQDSYPCPRCGKPSQAVPLAEGFTRREQIPWEQVAWPLPARYRGDSDVDRRPRARTRRSQDARHTRPPRFGAEQPFALWE